MGVPIRVLIVEDSEDDSAMILHELRRGGYEVQSQRVDNPSDLRSASVCKDWDLVISDFSMPHFSGNEALKMIRERHRDVPFIFVSGSMGEDTAVAAMKNGAQDYLMKNNLTRLVPAVQREIRDADERRERKRLELHVHQLQKFEAIGKLAGGIAHDFNNVLGAILGWAEMGQENCDPGSPSWERFRKIGEQGNRAAKLTSQLLAFARRQILQPRKVNINVLVREQMSFLEKVIGADVEISVLAAPGLRVTLADPVQLDQVLMNLCLNARDAMPSGGKLIIETRNVEIGEEYCATHAYARRGSYVLLSVSDTGMGMDAATVERIFEPFFTTKELGRGTGMGLATVYGIIKQHEGFIYVYSEPGTGTSFRVYLRADVGAPDPGHRPATITPIRGSETILFAEDHDGLRESGREMLDSLGYRVLLASNGAEAVEIFKNNSNTIDLVIMDLVMPALNGQDAFLQIAEIRPTAEVIFTTGYTSESAAVMSKLQDKMQRGMEILQKPYSLASLSQMIRNSLDRKCSV